MYLKYFLKSGIFVKDSESRTLFYFVTDPSVAREGTETRLIIKWTLVTTVLHTLREGTRTIWLLRL